MGMLSMFAMGQALIDRLSILQMIQFSFTGSERS